jgi:hypothetical protein
MLIGDPRFQDSRVAEKTGLKTGFKEDGFPKWLNSL